MATYYFTNFDSDTDWDNPDNWFDAATGGNALNSIPTSSDDVIIVADVALTGGSPVANSLVVDTNGIVRNISITVGGGTGTCTVQNGGIIGDSCTIYGNVTCTTGGIIGHNYNVANISGNLTFASTGATEAGTMAAASVAADVNINSDSSGSITYVSLGGNLNYYYGYSGSVSNMTVTGSTLYFNYPTLYFYNSMSTDWGTATNNWWVDSGHTQQANSIPTNTQDVILDSDVTSDSSTTATANNITVNYNGMNTGRLLISVTVVSTTIFSNDTFYGDGTNSITLTSPTVTFNGNSYLAANASIVGNVNFYDTSSNAGSITGNATVYSNHTVPFDSSHGNTGTISGSISYSGYSARTVYYYHAISSDDWDNLSNWWTDGSHGTNVDYVPNGDISSDDVIIESPIGSNNNNINVSVDDLVVSGSAFIGIDISCSTADFFDNSVFGTSSGTLTQNTPIGNITFHDLSENEGIIIPDASFPVEFRDSSFNTGTVSGNADVYYPSDKPVGGTVTGTVTYYGYTLYFTDGGGGNNGDWATTSNWFLDAGGSNGYNDVPSEIVPYQDVVIISNLTSYSGTGIPSANNLNTSGSYPYVDNISINIYNLATFSEETYLGSTGTITGNALFEDLATNRGGTITGSGTFELTAAAQMISNGYDGTYGAVEFKYGKGVNGSNILGIV